MTTLVILFFKTIKDRIDDSGSLERYWDPPVAYIKNPLVVFGDQDYIDFIKKHRPKEYLTEYNPMKLEDLHFYEYYNKIEENRRISWPSRDSRAPTSAHIIQANKIILLNYVAQRNPFGTQYFAYMDNNLMTRMKLTTDIVEDALNRMKNTFHIMLLGVVNPMLDYKDIYQAYRYHMVGGFTGGDAEHCNIVCKLFKHEFVRTVEEGYGHGEEMIYIKIVYSNWDLFTVSYGDYQDCVRNIHDIVQNHEYVFQLCVMKYLENKMYVQLEHCCDKLLSSIGLSSDLRLKSLYYKYIANYWLGNATVLYSTLDNIKDLISRDINARKSFYDNKDFYLSNINYASKYGHVPVILSDEVTVAYISNIITLDDVMKITTHGISHMILIGNKIVGVEEHTIPKDTTIIASMGSPIHNEALIMYLTKTPYVLFLSNASIMPSDSLTFEGDIMLYSDGSYCIKRDAYSKLDPTKNILSQLYEGKLKIRTQ